MSRISSASLNNSFRVLARGISSRASLDNSTTQVSFLNSLGNQQLGHGESQLPFDIPSGSWLRTKIGNTPLVHLHNDIFAKLEGHNPGGSVKDRTLSSIVLSMFKTGQLKKKGDTLCLVTSGSAGLSLTHIHTALSSMPNFDLNVVIVMPQKYAHKQIPAEIINLDCTTTYNDHEAMLEQTKGKSGSLSVLLMDGVFMDVLTATKEIAKKENWQMLDQHYDDNSMDGHRSTALELLIQCPDVTDVVCATGTGATAAGLVKHLPDHVRVHSRAAESGSIDGLSDVNRYNNFCDTKKLKGYKSTKFSASVAQDTLRDLSTIYNVEAGPSSGATYWLAKQIKTDNPESKIVFICADGRLTTDEVKQQPERVASIQRAAANRHNSKTRNPPVQGYPFMKTVLRDRDHPQIGRKIDMNCYTNFRRS